MSGVGSVMLGKGWTRVYAGERESRVMKDSCLLFMQNQKLGLTGSDIQKEGGKTVLQA